MPRSRTRSNAAPSMLAPYSSVAGEAFRSLRTDIGFGHKDPLRSLLVTSAQSGDGATTVATNLAVAFAHAGRHVLLIDADLRNPDVHARFGLSNDHGLSDWLRALDGGSPATLIDATRTANLKVLKAGAPPANPAELIGSPRMHELLNGSHDGNLVIVNGPAALGASEAAVLAALADATLVVVGMGRTALNDVVVARDVLGRSAQEVLGTVLNRRW